jgi:hypothetical protein
MKDHNMGSSRSYDEPSTIQSEAGFVTVRGPGAVNIVLTPDAAIRMANMLIEKAAEALGKLAINKDAERHGLTLPFPSPRPLS